MEARSKIQLDPHQRLQAVVYLPAHCLNAMQWQKQEVWFKYIYIIDSQAVVDLSAHRYKVIQWWKQEVRFNQIHTNDSI